MSEFSKKCKEFIKSKNTNVYQMSKRYDMERTALQRMVNGEKKVNREFVQKFCEYLNVSEAEQEELLELWKMDQLGEHTYYARHEIYGMLKEIEQICDSWNTSHIPKYEIEKADFNQKKMQIFRLEMDIVDAIRYAVSEEIATQNKPVIYMDFFKYGTYAMQQLIHQQKNYKKKIQCHQYVSLRIDDTKEAVIENISKLKWMLAFACSFQNEYIPKYVSAYAEKMGETLELLPHFLFTSTQIILISAKEDEAMVITDPDMIGFWKKQLFEKEKLYRMFFSSCCSVELGRYYEEFRNGSAEPLFELSPHPNWGMLFGKKENSVEEKKEIEKMTVCYFGLGEVVNCDMLGENVSAEAEEEKIVSKLTSDQYGERLLEGLNGEYEDCCLLKEKYQVLKNIYLEVYENNKVGFRYKIDEGHFLSIMIEEDNIYGMFYDYLKSLPEEGWVYTKEETKEMILSVKCER